VGQRLASQSADGWPGLPVLRDQGTTAQPRSPCRAASVFLHDGLVLASSSESELAGVLAHETAHVTQHHIARMIADQSKQSLTTAAALLGAILLGAIGGGRRSRAAIAAARVSASAASDNQLHARQRMGQRTAWASATSPGRLRSQRDGADFETHEPPRGARRTYIPAMLVDHPVTTDRIAEQRARGGRSFRPAGQGPRRAMSSSASGCAC